VQTASFRYRAVEWLREDRKLNTTWLPQNRIEDEHGDGRVDGSLVDAPLAPTLLTLSLWSSSLAAVIAMASQRPMDPASRQTLLAVAAAGAILFVVLLVTALALRRRGTRRVVAHLRASGPVDATTIRRLHADSTGHECWCIASEGFDDDALTAADQLGIVCFAARDDGFVPVGASTKDRRAA